MMMMKSKNYKMIEENHATIDTVHKYNDTCIEFISAQDERDVLAVLQYAPSFDSFNNFDAFN